MTDPTLGFAAQAAVGLIAGLVVGVAHFASLWWNARLFTTGSAGKAIALQLGRIAVAVAVLTLLPRLGFPPPLSGRPAFPAAPPFLCLCLATPPTHPPPLPPPPPSSLD